MEDLDVPPLVHHLRRAVELAVEELHASVTCAAAKSAPCSPCRNWLSIHDAKSCTKRSCSFAIEVDAVLREAFHRHQLDREHRLLGVVRVDVGRPVEVRVAVPLVLHRAPVEVVHLGVVALVAEVEVGVVARAHADRFALLAFLQQEAARHGRRQADQHFLVLDAGRRSSSRRRRRGSGARPGSASNRGHDREACASPRCLVRGLGRSGQWFSMVSVGVGVAAAGEQVAVLALPLGQAVRLAHHDVPPVFLTLHAPQPPIVQL